MIARRAFLLTPLALAVAQSKPKVLLIVAPQWRAQAMPWAGDLDLDAPNLEKFGKQSIVFNRAYSAYPSSTPARTALLTGRYPHATASDVTIETVLGASLRKVTPATPSSKPYDAAALHPRENVPSADEPKARRDQADRYGYYSALDREIGKLVASAADDTIVVFTAERGEQIGSQGLDGDDVAFEESVRIPLAIRIPRQAPAVSDVLVSQVDLMPTLLGLCGETADGLHGRDLSSLLTTQRGDRPESVYAEGKFRQKDEWRMLVLGYDKLVVNSQTEVTHLYNLAEDPYELNNQAHDSALLLKRDGLMAALRASMRRFSDFKRR